MEKITGQNLDELFPIVNPRELRWCEAIMKYIPKNQKQRRLKETILEVIRQYLPAFRIACMDPSEEDGKIIFKVGNKPALGHSPIWWERKFYNFLPEKNSRMGLDLHWAAIMGETIKYLVEEENYSAKDAWQIVCNDVGNYSNFLNSEQCYLLTGSRKIGRFYDLQNTHKIFKAAGTKAGFWVGSSGQFQDKGLAHMHLYWDSYYDHKSVGLMIMDV